MLTGHWNNFLYTGKKGFNHIKKIGFNFPPLSISLSISRFVDTLSRRAAPDK